jgi:hypothetical protein
MMHQLQASQLVATWVPIVGGRPIARKPSDAITRQRRQLSKGTHSRLATSSFGPHALPLRYANECGDKYEPVSVVEVKECTHVSNARIVRSMYVLRAGRTNTERANTVRRR